MGVSAGPTDLSAYSTSAQIAASYLTQANAATTYAAKGVRAASGSYAGNSSVNKAIAHGLGAAPKYVHIRLSNGAYWFVIIPGTNSISFHSTTPELAYYGVTAMDATNFYVGCITDYTRSANLNGSNYYWIAITDL